MRGSRSVFEESLSLLVESYTSALACPNMFRAFLQKAVRDTPKFSTLYGPVAALGFLTVAWAKPPIFAWKPYVLRCMGSADEPKQVWPAWGPQRDASMCIVGGCARGSCTCPPKVKEVVKGAIIDMNEVAGHIKYDDLLVKDSTTWLRCELSTFWARRLSGLTSVGSTRTSSTASLIQMPSSVGMVCLLALCRRTSSKIMLPRIVTLVTMPLL